MPAEDTPDPKPTLGQRIDALLGPLDEEAQAFREAITSGRAQLAQMQARIDQAEHALAGIEGKMVRVLQSLAAEEPMLALAMGAGDELDGLPPAAPAPAEPVAALDAAPPRPATPAPAAVIEPPAQAPETEPVDPETPKVVTLAVDEDEATGDAMPTPEEDAAAVDVILGLLDDEPGTDAPGASAPQPTSLADAAAQADEIARALGGIGEG